MGYGHGVEQGENESITMQCIILYVLTSRALRLLRENTNI
jgi:hypothetical protein